MNLSDRPDKEKLVLRFSDGTEFEFTLNTNELHREQEWRKLRAEIDRRQDSGLSLEGASCYLRNQKPAATS